MDIATLIPSNIPRPLLHRFINLDVSILTDKWYGESQKLASAVFTLARKLSPCIVFVDEIDSLLRSRNTHGKTEIKQFFKLVTRMIIRDKKQISEANSFHSNWKFPFV